MATKAVTGADLLNRYGEGTLLKFHTGIKQVRWINRVIGTNILRIKFYGELEEKEHKLDTTFHIVETPADQMSSANGRYAFTAIGRQQ